MKLIKRTQHLNSISPCYSFGIEAAFNRVEDAKAVIDNPNFAEYLDDRYDYNFDNLDTYSSEEKQLYVIANRTKTKQMWWSPASIYAMIFEKKSAAEYQAKKYKYNKVRIKQITQEMADIEYFINNYTE